MTMSAAAYLPKDHSPQELAGAIERQAVWIERQNQTNVAHWQKIQELEGSCKDCRNDRRTVDRLVLESLDELKSQLLEIRAGLRWTAMASRVVFAVVGLYVAAKAAGVIK